MVIVRIFLAAGSQSATEQHGNGDCKRQETEAPSAQAASASHLDLNFPLPGENGPSCLVKVGPARPIAVCGFPPGADGVCVCSGVRGLGRLQAERHAGGLRDPVGQSRSQRSDGWKVRRISPPPAPCAASIPHRESFCTTGTPSWTRLMAWRLRRSRESTARRRRSSLVFTCCTPGGWRTTTRCCRKAPWEETPPVRNPQGSEWLWN